MYPLPLASSHHLLKWSGNNGGCTMMASAPAMICRRSILWKTEFKITDQSSALSKSWIKTFCSRRSTELTRGFSTAQNWTPLPIKKNVTSQSFVLFSLPAESIKLTSSPLTYDTYKLIEKKTNPVPSSKLMQKVPIWNINTDESTILKNLKPNLQTTWGNHTTISKLMCNTQ